MKNINEIKETLKNSIRDIPNFPKQGILFKDITTLLKNSSAFSLAIDVFIDILKDKKIDYIVGLESRGFIFGAAIAYKLGIGFVPIRKKGKLPAETVSASYELEYGTDVIEVHKDAIHTGANVVIIDDLLATGGTAAATYELIKKVGGNVVSSVFLIELVELNGRAKLPQNTEIISILEY